jgi:hypothetical protein
MTLFSSLVIGRTSSALLPDIAMLKSPVCWKALQTQGRVRAAQ